MELPRAPRAPDDPLNRPVWPSAKGSGHWFEWWYYKVVIPASADSFYFVYGVVNPNDTAGRYAATHAFVGFGAPSRGVFLMRRAPVGALGCEPSRYELTLDGGRADSAGIAGDLCEQGHRVHWQLATTSRWTFPAMGWVARYPGLSNIHWHPAQADARFDGVVELDGERISLVDSPGYQDHNWGVSFPRWWCWIASNAFEGDDGAALVVGGGLPAVLTRVELDAVACVGLRLGGHEYTFRTHHFHSTRVAAALGGWDVEARRGRHRVEIRARAPEPSFFRIDLVKPDGGTFHNHETLSGRVDVVLKERQALLRWRTVAQLSSLRAGIEFGSDSHRPELEVDRCFHGPEPR